MNLRPRLHRERSGLSYLVGDDSNHRDAHIYGRIVAAGRDGWKAVSYHGRGTCTHPYKAEAAGWVLRVGVEARLEARQGKLWT